MFYIELSRKIFFLVDYLQVNSLVFNLLTVDGKGFYHLVEFII